jgi:uncharacterized 2Fe-2S/4Fe-4S cluster protein (DUF4445 family)
MSMIRFEPWGREVQVEPGSTVLDAARGAGIPLVALCGGRGTCGKCVVRILSGPVPAPSARELAVLGEASVNEGRRFACACPVTAPLIVETFPIHVYGKSESPPLDRTFALSPPVRYCAARCVPPTLDDPRADDASLRAALEAAGMATTGVDWQAARGLSTTLRAAQWSVRAAVRCGEIIAVRPALPRAAPLGAAVDLGTTNLALYLYRLDSGSLETVCGAPNPLSPYGADIVTRLMYSLESPGNGETMRHVLVKALNLLSERAAREIGRAADDIDEMVVVGNSGMHHLFLDLPGRQLVMAPFVPALHSALSIKARDMGIALAPGGYVHMPALVGGFVGSDLLAVALSARLDRKPGVRLAVDIGTNTELLLSVNGSLSACSTASGPALEGAALRYGTMASAGAVDRMSVQADGEPLSFHAIGDVPVTGICGSGILEALACMRRLGIVNRSGRMQEGKPGVAASADGDHLYVLVAAGKTALGGDLTISQSEVRSLQLAKGAIRAGIETLCALQGVESGQLEEIVVAGTFGNQLQIDSAVEIGLFPRLPAGAIRQVGNAAGTGAALMLLSVDERRESDALSASIRYVELGREAGFMRRFAECQWFPGGDT